MAKTATSKSEHSQSGQKGRSRASARGSTRTCSVPTAASSSSSTCRRAVARSADARLNDYFVAGVAGGLRRYHEGHGNRVGALRMSMPINLRDEASQNKAGNQFVPVRVDVPLDIDDPRERMRTIRDLVKQQRAREQAKRQAAQQRRQQEQAKRESEG